MIVLDTNVISEPLKPAGNPSVLAWLDQQDIETLFLTAISVAELRFGITALPSGSKKRRLHDAFERRIFPLFEGRVLPFDLAASDSYARVRAHARAEGRAIGVADGYIAAIAATHRFAVATRDTSPFEAAGVSVIDPWK